MRHCDIMGMLDTGCLHHFRNLAFPSIPHFCLMHDLDARTGAKAGCSRRDHLLCILGRADAAGGLDADVSAQLRVASGRHRALWRRPAQSRLKF